MGALDSGFLLEQSLISAAFGLFKIRLVDGYAGWGVKGRKQKVGFEKRLVGGCSWTENS